MKDIINTIFLTHLLGEILFMNHIVFNSIFSNPSTMLEFFHGYRVSTIVLQTFQLMNERLDAIFVRFIYRKPLICIKHLDNTVAKSPIMRIRISI